MSIPALKAKECAQAAGGRLVDFTQRESRGLGQKCPWDLVVATGPEPEDRAATAWIIADEIMRARTDVDDLAYQLWRDSVLAGVPLAGNDRAHVLLYAGPVFEANDPTGVTGYIAEWLWYLSTRDLPPDVGRSVEILDPPSSTVTDSGPDGLVIHRVPGSELGFVFRLWETKKFTAEKTKPSDTIRKAWQQLNTWGARYLGQISWGGRELAPDTRTFVGSMARQWVEAKASGNGGVSIALDAADTPDTAFERSHKHFTTHTHPGALRGVVVAIDDLEDFAKDVRGYVWSAL
ncbi:hypothetical protein [Streptomyces clavuligerus]|uniref:hypothetical protein n=1 Tax=Streptomyces clavuligerus TaxID=1901 RepID=UPI000D0A9A2F|nr:hypothetical protein [Streptomyces clavuligerus]AXU16782.1 hypothetical protein D1794_28830 [Streptomyces clavuligerus]QPJ97070.1 hypothetical protein GE265_28625 [Streptomyces clavuligerus]WDN55719.1 hypothetical protein LL058_27865 [Streptomyces clavuligerus]